MPLPPNVHASSDANAKPKLALILNFALLALELFLPLGAEVEGMELDFLKSLPSLGSLLSLALKSFG